jgi:hypothetical protein
MANEIICPVCGSKDLEKLVDQKSHQLTLGGDFQYMEEYYKCNICKEAGDFANIGNYAFKEAEERALKELVPNLIEDLSHHGISMARFERAFELPQRTLTRWKTGDFSSAGVALLRVVKTFPFVVRVAEWKFDPLIAKKSVCAEAIQFFGNVIDSSGGEWVATVSQHMDGTSVAIGGFVPTDGIRTNVPPALTAAVGS